MLHMLKESWDLLFSLVKGMAITLRQMFVKPFTVQYPEERVIWPDRTRGRLILPRDPATGQHRCTACQLCEKICPNGSIEIKMGRDANNKRRLDDYLHHLDRCSFCGLCVETCGFNALCMSREHELASRGRAQFQRHLQDENIPFNDAWRGGLPAKADQTAAPAAESVNPARSQA